MHEGVNKVNVEFVPDTIEFDCSGEEKAREKKDES
jgi:hypothetical protein